MFNTLMYQDQLPFNWKQANVVTRFKKGSRAQPINYQPTFLTSVIWKTLECIIHVHNFSHCNYNNNTLCDQQHDFCLKRLCESQLITTIIDIAKTLVPSVIATSFPHKYFTGDVCLLYCSATCTCSYCWHCQYLLHSWL